MVRETLDNKSYSSFSSYYFDVEATVLCMLLPTLSTSYVLCAIFITNLFEHYFRHNGEVWTQNLFRIIKPFFIFLSARYLSLSLFPSLSISLSYYLLFSFSHYLSLFLSLKISISLSVCHVLLIKLVSFQVRISLVPFRFAPWLQKSVLALIVKS